jgi:hypothetical protein
MNPKRSITYVMTPGAVDRELRKARPSERMRTILNLRATNASVVARAIGVSIPKMCRIAYRGQQPTYREALKIADFLRAPVDVLFSGKAASRHYLDIEIPEEWK